VKYEKGVEGKGGSYKDAVAGKKSNNTRREECVKYHGE
jgi:hypothetical protein